MQIISQFNNDYAKTLFSNLFNIVLKSEKNKQTPNWQLINDYLNNVDRELLSKECQRTQDNKELPSDYEKWYAEKSNALLKLGKWDECLIISKEALEKIDKFHNSNSVWISRRIALAKKAMGNINDAIQELQLVVKKKRDWYIQKELAELYFEKGDIDNASNYALMAVNNYGLLENKVNLLTLLGEILKKQNNLDLSFKHYSLAKLIRERKKWRIPAQLTNALKSFPYPEIKQKEFDAIKNELQEYWKSFKSSNKNVGEKPSSTTKSILEGEIVKILHDNERGKVGFVKSNGKEYYFSVNTNFPAITKIVVGTRVQFEILPQKRDDNKVQIKIIKVFE